MIGGPETHDVQRPLIDQLVAMGWTATKGKLDHPSATHRRSFSEGLLLEDLRYALLRINTDHEGNPWMDDDRVNQAVSALEGVGELGLMEANRAATRLLLGGARVTGTPAWDRGQDQTVHYMDWDHPENNTFRVISQFRLDSVPGASGESVVPDLVLFVNGVPLVVIECRSPGTVDPLAQAIIQLQRYGNRRERWEGGEGNERLFHYAQVVVATCFEKAVFGTVGSEAVDFREWKDTSPVPMDYVAANLGKERLSGQEILVAGMLRPELLLDIVRNFTLFRDESGGPTKILPRYHQFRAVRLAVQRLQDGSTREEDGELDRRGGVIWHAQGSGKSLTMTFLIRKLRSQPELRRFKVVAVTSRRDIEEHLSAAIELVGDRVEVCESRGRLGEALSEKGPALLCAVPSARCDALLGPPLHEASGGEDAALDRFPTLDPDSSVVVLVDEPGFLDDASLQHNLMVALPNSARIGFTGIPIADGARRRALAVFGPLIDRYTPAQSENDRCTVPVLVESRTAVGAADRRHETEDVFEDLYRELTSSELQAIGQRYATSGLVGEAPELIAAKVRSMLRHYVEHLLPNGLKAQVVPGSRRAIIRYHRAFEEAWAGLVTELEGLEPHLLDLEEERVRELPNHTRFLLRAHGHLDTIRELESAPVMCGDPSDPPAWAPWTDPAGIEVNLGRFRRPLFHDDPAIQDRLAFLFIDSMLLAEVNAPVAGVLYLDRRLEGGHLLKAIGSLNRPSPGKRAGLAVDYHGVTAHLKDALRDFPQEDVAGVLRNLRDESPRLRNLHLWLVAWFAGLGVEDATDTEACVEALKNMRVRAEYLDLVRQFLETLDLLLPRAEALRYVGAARTFTFVLARARNLYRDEAALVGSEVGGKVWPFIGPHLVSRGIDLEAQPLSITDSEFEERMEEETSDRNRAMEMEHALRSYLRSHPQAGSEYIEELEDRLEEVLTTLEGRWGEVAAELRALIREVNAARSDFDLGLDLATEAPFLRILRRELRRKGDVSVEELSALVPITVQLVGQIRKEVRLLDFWRSSEKQDGLRGAIINTLDSTGLYSRDRIPEVAKRIMEEARANPPRMVPS